MRKIFCALEITDDLPFRQLLIEIAMKHSSEGKGKSPAEGKTREQVLAEREAKKLAKQMAKTGKSEIETTVKVAEPAQSAPATTDAAVKPQDATVEKSREQVLAERAAKKKEKKQGGKVKPKTETEVKPTPVPTQPEATEKTQSVEAKKEETEGAEKSKAQLRAERREKQEAQRAKKAEGTVKEIKVEKKISEPATPAAAAKKEGPLKPKKPAAINSPHRVKLFAHLYAQSEISSRWVNSVPCRLRKILLSYSNNSGQDLLKHLTGLEGH